MGLPINPNGSAKHLPRLQSNSAFVAKYTRWVNLETRNWVLQLNFRVQRCHFTVLQSQLSSFNGASYSEWILWYTMTFYKYKIEFIKLTFLFHVGAKGSAGKIPMAYRVIERSFFNKIAKFKQADRVTIWEFARSGWTYHAKGLWYFPPRQQNPCLTLIGSPNFGKFSGRKNGLVWLWTVKF